MTIAGYLVTYSVAYEGGSEVWFDTIEAVVTWLKTERRMYDDLDNVNIYAVADTIDVYDLLKDKEKTE